MRRLNKLQTFLLIFAFPTILRILIFRSTDTIILTIVTILMYGLISLWYYGLLTSIKENAEINRTEEIIIKAFLVWLVVYPVLVVNFFMKSFTDVPTEIPTALKVGNIFFPLLGFLSLYLLTINFEKVLTIRNEKDNKFLIFILLAVYPIGIWRYHDKIMVDKVT